jgi:hypothetical protein
VYPVVYVQKTGGKRRTKKKKRKKKRKAAKKGEGLRPAKKWKKVV